MRTKLVYVLASTENDLFYEQCLISVYSAQLYNPNIKIVLVVDNKTHSTLKGNRKEITDYVDDIIVKDFPEETSMFMRSRLLKVELRSLVKGDYLYVDCDTLIVDSLESIDWVSESIAAVLDGHVKLKNHPTYALFKKQCELGSEALSGVIGAILEGKVTLTPMPKGGTLHLSKDIPADGMLDLNAGFKEISALLRAMDYGALMLLGKTKVSIGGETFSFYKYKISDEPVPEGFSGKDYGFCKEGKYILLKDLERVK